MRNMDKRQYRHCFLSAHFAELSWGKESTIYVPPTTPMLKSRVRYLPQSGRSRSTIPDDSRRSPMLNLRYQELGQCATWIKGSTDTAFYPRILPNCHGRVVTVTVRVTVAAAEPVGADERCRRVRRGSARRCQAGLGGWQSGQALHLET
jgi:hypothetical protein